MSDYERYQWCSTHYAQTLAYWKVTGSVLAYQTGQAIRAEMDALKAKHSGHVPPEDKQEPSHEQ